METEPAATPYPTSGMPISRFERRMPPSTSSTRPVT
jgi:hypothetical protein